jgi:outer membrane protein assembly factor BamD
MLKRLFQTSVTFSVVMLGLATPGCKTLEGDAGQPNYTSDAESNLAKGNEALASKNYIEAEKFFEYVRSKYPFLEASKEAELRLADTDFEREQFLEARDRYQNFVKLHPTHSKVDYAAYQAALTHYKEIPSDFFLLPPSREKDQVEVRSAQRALGEFVRQYPSSSHAAEAKAQFEETRKRLADHEMYVASFYRKRERWPAVVARLERVVAGLR